MVSNKLKMLSYALGREACKKGIESAYFDEEFKEKVLKRLILKDHTPYFMAWLDGWKDAQGNL